MKFSLAPEKVIDALIDALKWLLLIAASISAFILVFKFSYQPGFEWVSRTLATCATMSGIYLLLFAPKTLVYVFLQLLVIGIIPASIAALIFLGQGFWFIALPLAIYIRIVHSLNNMKGFEDCEKRSKDEIAYENHYLIKVFQYGWRLYWNKR